METFLKYINFDLNLQGIIVLFLWGLGLYVLFTNEKEYFGTTPEDKKLKATATDNTDKKPSVDNATNPPSAENGKVDPQTTPAAPNTAPLGNDEQKGIANFIGNFSMLLIDYLKSFSLGFLDIVVGKGPSSVGSQVSSFFILFFIVAYLIGITSASIADGWMNRNMFHLGLKATWFDTYRDGKDAYPERLCNYLKLYQSNNNKYGEDPYTVFANTEKYVITDAFYNHFFKEYKKDMKGRCIIELTQVDTINNTKYTNIDKEAWSCIPDKDVVYDMILKTHPKVKIYNLEKLSGMVAPKKFQDDFYHYYTHKTGKIKALNGYILQAKRCVYCDGDFINSFYKFAFTWLKQNGKEADLKTYYERQKLMAYTLATAFGFIGLFFLIITNTIANIFRTLVEIVSEWNKKPNGGDTGSIRDKLLKFFKPTPNNFKKISVSCFGLALVILPVFHQLALIAFITAIFMSFVTRSKSSLTSNIIITVFAVVGYYISSIAWYYQNTTSKMDVIENFERYTKADTTGSIPEEYKAVYTIFN